MQLAEITRESVLLAIAECDRLGRDTFLSHYGFSEALEYYLLFGGNVYDSKAIVGVAYRFDTGAIVRSDDFTGGQAVANRLAELGFSVTGNADWQWFELVAAADILHVNGWQYALRADEAQVVELSQFLRSQRPELGEAKRYRSPNSVHRKLEDLRTVHPGYAGKRTKGGRLTVQVVEAFLAEPDRMHDVAQAIREVGRWDSEPDPMAGDGDGSGLRAADERELVTAVEGRIRRRLALVRERDPRLRRSKIAQSRSLRGNISCETCGFDFEDAYGGLGAGFIHVHHVTPLYSSGKVETDLDDLVLLCANCHQMVHRARPDWLTPSQLRDVLSASRSR